MSALSRFVASSDDPMIQSQWGALVEALDYIYGTSPSHEVNEPYYGPVTMEGDDLAGMLHYVDVANTVVSDHEFVSRGLMSLCSSCYNDPDAPHHRNADDLTERGLI